MSLAFVEFRAAFQLSSEGAPAQKKPHHPQNIEHFRLVIPLLLTPHTDQEYLLSHLCNY